MPSEAASTAKSSTEFRVPIQGQELTSRRAGGEAANGYLEQSEDYANNAVKGEGGTVNGYVDQAGRMASFVPKLPIVGCTVLLSIQNSRWHHNI